MGKVNYRWRRLREHGYYWIKGRVNNPNSLLVVFRPTKKGYYADLL